MDIDRIARQIVDAEPSADLEARIRARLDQVQTAGRRPSWWLWRVGAPLGATAALALAIGLAVQGPESRVQSPGADARVGVQESRGPGVGNQPAAVAQAASAAMQKTDISPLRTLPPLRHYGDAQRAQASALSMEESAWMERRFPALEPVDALRVDRLTYESIQPEALSITPLLMTAMRTDGADIDRQNNR